MVHASPAAKKGRRFGAPLRNVNGRPAPTLNSRLLDRGIAAAALVVADPGQVLSITVRDVVY
ncbi:hypothetical protein [Azospirillum sp. ST 5-10]|uniref:hypothetical protein n=1 Tax=unclassified Azospirillum TaxID=2630922 RepID=UPI003F4A0409